VIFTQSFLVLNLFLVLEPTGVREKGQLRYTGNKHFSENYEKMQISVEDFSVDTENDRDIYLHFLV
jgi:hypothetical protein